MIQTFGNRISDKSASVPLRGELFCLRAIVCLRAIQPSGPKLPSSPCDRTQRDHGSRCAVGPQAGKAVAMGNGFYCDPLRSTGGPKSASPEHPQPAVERYWQRCTNRWSSRASRRGIVAGLRWDRPVK